MAVVQYICSTCNKTASFETTGATMIMLDDDKPRPAIYLVNCPHCNASNSVSFENV